MSDLRKFKSDMLAPHLVVPYYWPQLIGDSMRKIYAFIMSAILTLSFGASACAVSSKPYAEFPSGVFPYRLMPSDDPLVPAYITFLNNTTETYDRADMHLVQEKYPTVYLETNPQASVPFNPGDELTLYYPTGAVYLPAHDLTGGYAFLWAGRLPRYSAEYYATCIRSAEYVPNVSECAAKPDGRMGIYFELAEPVVPEIEEELTENDNNNDDSSNLTTVDSNNSFDMQNATSYARTSVVEDDEATSSEEVDFGDVDSTYQMPESADKGSVSIPEVAEFTGAKVSIVPFLIVFFILAILYFWLIFFKKRKDEEEKQAEANKK